MAEKSQHTNSWPSLAMNRPRRQPDSSLTGSPHICTTVSNGLVWMSRRAHSTASTVQSLSTFQLSAPHSGQSALSPKAPCVQSLPTMRQQPRQVFDLGPLAVMFCSCTPPADQRPVRSAPQYMYWSRNRPSLFIWRRRVNSFLALAAPSIWRISRARRAGGVRSSRLSRSATASLSRLGA
ncbi:hypothetical protein D3C77_336260 [compost metagenome]